MKKIVILNLMIALSLLSSEITLQVTNISNKKGKIAIGLYNKDSDFANISKKYKSAYLKIDNTTIIYTFKNIPNGIYAISVFHDENENKKLDKNFFGVPKEGYGFSNNIRPTFRSATFDESKFELKKDKKITIKVEY